MLRGGTGSSPEWPYRPESCLLQCATSQQAGACQCAKGVPLYRAAVPVCVCTANLHRFTHTVFLSVLLLLFLQ
jgi:hypothetical protein